MVYECKDVEKVVLETEMVVYDENGGNRSRIEEKRRGGPMQRGWVWWEMKVEEWCRGHKYMCSS